MNRRSSPGLVLVTGATGAQGGATARCLLAHGRNVRILTRSPGAPAARALALAGAVVVRGDLDDRETVDAALHGASGVFSVQVPDVTGTDSERRHGHTLVQAALAAGVRQFVHTSVDRCGDHLDFPGWQGGYWNPKYWTDKWDVELAVRAAGFASWTVLRPVFLMDNFAEPKARFMFPHLSRGEIVTALHATTRMQLIAADDVGSFAQAAFDDPQRFNGQNLSLAAEALTMGEVAAIISRVLGSSVTAVTVTPAEAIARGLFPGWVRSQEWTNEVGYSANIGGMSAHGIALTSFEQWVATHRASIHVRR